MEQEISQFLQMISWAGVAGLFVWKVLAPLTRFFIKNRGGNNIDAMEKVEKLESNDLGEIRRDIRELRINQTKMREDIARLKAKVFNKNS